MILFPVGHEHESVRRKPWVTLGLLVLTTAVYVALGFGLLGDGSARADAIEEVATYYAERPWLELDEEAQRLLFGGPEVFEQLFPEDLRASFESLKPDWITLNDQQAELEGLVRAAAALEQSDPYRRFGLVPAEVTLLGLFAHMLLHGGVLHLVGNMLLLYLVAPLIEDVWGRSVTLGLYVLGGLAAALSHVASEAGSAVPMIGASGAVAAMMGAFALRYATTRMQFFYWAGFFLRGTFWAPAWLMLALWFGQQVFFASFGVEDGIAYVAHVGGFAFGALVAFGIRASGAEEKVLAPSIRRAIDPEAVEADPRLDEALALAYEGDARGAWTQLSALYAEDRNNLDVCLALWEIAKGRGWQGQAVEVVEQALRIELREGLSFEAAEHYQELKASCPEVVFDAELTLRLVPPLIEADRAHLAHDALSRVLAAQGEGMPTSRLMRLARLALPIDEDLAAHAAGLALVRSDLHPEDRPEAEELAALARPVMIT